MQSKGTLGSLVSGVIAIFLVIVCAFYLSFSIVTNHFEKNADEIAAIQSGTTDSNSDLYKAARKSYMDSIAKTPVWLGYNFNEVQKWGIGLGLDLKGGMNVTLQVSMPDILRAMKTDGKDAAFDKAIAATDSLYRQHKTDDYVGTFVKEYRAAEDNDRLADLAVIFPDIVKSGDSDTKAVDRLKEEVVNRVNNSATNVLRNRIDAFGVVSPNIQVLRGKDGQILLELPGVKDQQRMTELIKRSANLEFYESFQAKAPEVISKLTQLSAAQRQSGNYEGKGVGDYMRIGLQNASIVGLAKASDRYMVDSLLRAPEARNYFGAETAFRWANKPITDANNVDYYYLYALKTNEGRPALDGRVVVNAVADYDPQSGNGSYVSMRMDNDGAKQWAKITGNNIGYPIAIVLDDVVYSAPNVNGAIEGGSSQITGNFTVQEAQDLANVLKSGKMDFKIDIISSMTVGPSLGQQAIDAGIMSFIVALVLLMIFMICMYGWIPGLVANLGLVFNLFFTVGILSSFQAVLTLSGIAGIVLALGMAVDANVLIFERSKEELRAGKNIRTAISDGYSNAFSAIFDSNLTSIITGVILLYFGTGPIKGFATTLIIGIICSFFTAVYLTRIVFILGAKNKAFEAITFTTPLSRNIFTNAHYNFLGQMKKSAAVVGAFIIIVIVSFVVRQLNPGIDFSGGRNYIVKCEAAADPVAIKANLADKFDGASLSVINIMEENQVRVSTNYKIDAAEDAEAVDAEITHILYDTLKGMGLIGDMNYDHFSTLDDTMGVLSSQTVGPTVADDMRTSAYIAVTLSLLAMFLYILIRFRNVAFSFGALAAVAFTAFTIVGIYSIGYDFLPFSMEVDQTFIAAVLTIIGYQINDTVVVFDRVRENLELYPKQDFYTTINKSLNSTLGRTIMTSLSTLLVLLCIFILGGDSIRSFVFAMLFGVITGTLSTLYIATPVAYLIGRKKIGAKA
ncbi:MAG: protein translocase subunit SecD [Muribaculaceae bacterium]|nr:protein translocase subunit SecD [Muribaculaceae bacterium]